MGFMKLTTQELALLNKVYAEGHSVTEIEKTNTEFRVHFGYHNSNAIGSRALIYNLRASIAEIRASIAETEAEIKELKARPRPAGLGPR